MPKRTIPDKYLHSKWLVSTNEQVNLSGSENASQNVAPSNFYAPWSDLARDDDNREALSSPLKPSQFHQYLLQRMNEKTAGDRMRYAKRYAHVLTLASKDAKVLNELLQLSPNKRIHAMKALSCLAKFTGQYDNWVDIRRRYNLTWSTGNESLATFERFFLDDKKTLDSMLDWVREAIAGMPAHMAAIIKFNCLTGLRPNEAIQAVRLLNCSGDTTPNDRHAAYYNEERQCLEHFRHPEIFLRRTKACYVSIVNKEILGIVQNIGNTPTYEVIRFRLERAGLACHLGYCRKIFASWLRQSGIESETIDLLQGRVPRSVFARHYFSPSVNYRQKVMDSLDRLSSKL